MYEIGRTASLAFDVIIGVIATKRRWYNYIKGRGKVFTFLDAESLLSGAHSLIGRRPVPSPSGLSDGYSPPECVALLLGFCTFKWIWYFERTLAENCSRQISKSLLTFSIDGSITNLVETTLGT